MHWTGVRVWPIHTHAAFDASIPQKIIIFFGYNSSKNNYVAHATNNILYIFFLCASL